MEGLNMNIYKKERLSLVRASYRLKLCFLCKNENAWRNNLFSCRKCMVDELQLYKPEKEKIRALLDLICPNYFSAVRLHIIKEIKIWITMWKLYKEVIWQRLQKRR